MRLENAVDEFLLALTAEGRSKGTVAWYSALLRTWVSRYGHYELSKVTPSLMRRYLVWLREQAPKTGKNRRLSASTLYAHHRALRSFWSWAAAEWGIVSPMANIRRMNPPHPAPRAADYHDLRQMWKVAGMRDRIILALLIDTGCRVGDLCNLKWADVDLGHGRAVVIGKRGKPRVLFLSEFTIDLLKQWRESGRQAEYVLYGRINDNITRYGVNRALRRLARRAGIGGRYNAHSIRHGFAQWYLLHGGDAGSLSRILGHANVAFTLEIYGIFDVNETQAQHARHSPVEVLCSEESTDT